MSMVYRAQHLRLERTVALKVLMPELSQDDSFKERFTRESRLAASLDHPNVIPIYEAGDEGGVFYIAMRFVGGSTLKHVLETDGPLPAARAASVMSQVASALQCGARGEGARPPRREAGEHPGRVGTRAGRRRSRLPLRLRHRQAARCGGADQDGNVRRHGRLRRARADRGPRARPARRRLRARLRPVRDAHRGAHLREGFGGCAHVRAPPRAAAAGDAQASRPLARDRRRGGQGDGEVTGRPLRDDARVRRRRCARR